MLKDVGPLSIAYVARLINLLMSTLSIPSLWKIGRIIPILKPNKSPDQSTSYHPISVLSPLTKLLEKLVLGTLTEHLQLAEYPHDHDHIQRGLNEKRPNKRTVMVAVDLSRAVKIGILMKITLETTLPPIIKRWLGNYLLGRQTYVKFRNINSKYRRVKQGVPKWRSIVTYTIQPIHVSIATST